MSEAASLTCPHADICGVCGWIQLSGAEQKDRKIQALKDSLQAESLRLPDILNFHSAGLGAIRDRVDMTFQNGQYGFFKKNTREIFQVEECPLLSGPLFEYFNDVRRIAFPIRKGSVRLRVSPQGERGLWLDFANEDIRDLLQEKNCLQAALDLGFVEIGQRRKKLTKNFKLEAPEFHTWTRTWVGQEPLNLLSLVGGFSQSGDRANRILIQQMEELFSHSESQEWIEFGAGSGNLTFPLAGLERRVQALEFDALALQGLEATLRSNPEFENRIEILQGDFQRKPHTLYRPGLGVLVNPPRSGLMKFLDPLFEIPKIERPRDFVYMSCYLESFTQDGKRLAELGYELEEISIVDQFPNSPHFEILSRWRLH